MFVISCQFDSGSGQLQCPFCRDSYAIPLGIEPRGATYDPTPEHVIQRHHGASSDPTLATWVTCPNAAGWTSMPWTLRDAHDGGAPPRASGDVELLPDGTLRVTTKP